MSAVSSVSASKETDTSLQQQQIVTITKKIEYNELKIKEEETKIKNIMKEYVIVDPDDSTKKSIDEKKKEMKMSEIKKHMAEKKRLQALIDTATVQLENLQRLVRAIQNTGAGAGTVSASSKGGKRRKTTTRKQKGRRTTKKQNKNKKSRKQ